MALSPSISPTMNAFKRVDSFSNLFYKGEQGPSFIMEQCTNAHKKVRDAETGILRVSPFHNGFHRYGSITTKEEKCIRFQVIIWSAGPVNVLDGRVTMKFRVTLFWNSDEISDTDTTAQKESQNGSSSSSSNGNKKGTSFWVMNGRSRAYQSQMSELSCKFINVPQLSILNAVTFDVIGAPEVACLNEKQKLMRWSCLYKAELLQENMRVHRYVFN